MARLVGRLTARQVATAKPPPHRRSVVLGDGGCLYLQCTVGKDGHVRRSWLFKYERRDDRRSMGLGNVETRGLADARRKARELRLQLLDGIDPLAQRRKARADAAVGAAKSISFAQAAARYIDSHSAGWRSKKHLAQWQSSMANYVEPIIGALPVSVVDTVLVMKVLEQSVREAPDKPAERFWTARPETASRVRQRVELVLDWARARGLREGENPARWGHLKNLLPPKGKVRAVEHFAALDYREVGALMTELRAHDTLAARALEFAVLCAARSGEVIDARWDEFDFAAKTWTIPASRMKTGKAHHRIPLSARAVAILAGLPRDHGERVFKLSATAMWKTLGTLRPSITVHGFRSSFRDWAAEQTAFPSEVAEMALAHRVGNATERAYARGDLLDKRRKLMDAWADFCARPAPVGATVVQMHGAAP